MEVRRIDPRFGLAETIKALDDRTRRLETKPTGAVVIRDTLTTTDPNTGVSTTIGALPDGTFGLQQWINDTTPPDQPSTPTASCVLGAAVITWDGLDVNGALPPKDYDRTVLQISSTGASGASGWTTVDELRGKGSAHCTGLTADTTYYFQLVSLDANQNASIPSAVVSVLITAPVDDSTISAAIASVNQTATAAKATADGKNTSYYQGTQPTGGTYKAGDLWFDTSNNYRLSTYTGTAWQLAQDATAALTVAQGKNKTYIQSTAPAASASVAGDLWMDSANGFRLNRFDGTSWALVQDTAIASANSTAAAAQSTANSKNAVYYQSTQPTGGTYKAGDIWFDTANSYRVSTYTGSAWQITQDAANALATAQSKNKTLIQSTAPAASAVVAGDLWMDSANGYRLNRWSGSAWVLVQDAAIASASGVAASKNTTYYQSTQPTGGTYKTGDIWFDTANNYRISTYTGSTWQLAQDAALAQATANSKNQTFIQGTAPTANAVGDLWMDSANGYRLNRWSGSAWVLVQDAAIATAQSTASSKNKSTASSTAPSSPATGDIWIDTSNGNVIKTWSGSAWVSMQDTAIAAANNAATAAQSTANSKNAVYYQSTQPATNLKAGDIWFDTANNYRVSTYTGSAWQLTQDAANALTVAQGKNKTSIQSTAPAASASTVGDLWMDSSNGNVLKRWDGSTWVNVQDAAIGAAQTAANNAQTSANGKNTSYYQSTQPSGGTYKAGDLWFDTSNGYRVSTYTGSAWQLTQDSANALSVASGRNANFVQSTAPTAKAVGDIWIDTSNGNVIRTWNGSAWVNSQDAAIAAANSAATAAQATANGKNTSYYQSTQPSGGTYKAGDLWFDTSNSYRVSTYTGSAWQLTQDSANALTVAQGRNATFTQSTAPTAKATGDIWIDTSNGNVIKTWNGSSWVNVQDAAIAAAQSTANGKNKTLIQSTAPAASSVTTGDLWMDSANGYRLNRWSGSAWVNVQDSAIGTAQTSANNALTTAQGKNVTFIQSTAPAASASTTGDLWIDSANGYRLNRWSGSAWANVQDSAIASAQSSANTALSTANGKNTTFIQTTAPTASATGDLWIDTSNGNRLNRWNGTAWVNVQDSAIASAQSSANNAMTVAQGKNVTFIQSTAPTASATGDIWLDSSNGYRMNRWNGTAWVNVQDSAIATAQSAANTAQTTANGKNTTFIQSTAPTASATGDLWIDTSNGNRLNRWNGSAWANVQDSAIATAQSAANTAQTIAQGKNVTFVAASAPTASATGDIWLDSSNGYRMSRWSGSAWVNVQDAAIATAQSTANSAQTSANGKNTVTYSANAASGSGTAVGDTWFQTSSGVVIAQWQWSGSAWVSQTIGNQVIAALDAGKITAGTLDVQRLGAKTITVDKLVVADLSNYALGGNFDSATDLSNWNAQSVHSVAASGMYSGTGCLQIAANATTQQLLLKTLPPVTPGDKLYVSFRYKTSSDWNGTVNNSKLRLGDQSGNIVSATTLSLQTAWVQASAVFTVPSGMTNLQIQIVSDHTVGTVWWDEVTVRRQGGSELIVDGSITGTKIAADTITAAQIAAGAITASELAANSITATAIAANAITATAIAADTITAGQIAAGAITSSELAAGSVGASSLTANTVTATAIAANTITANQLAAGSVTASQIAAGAVTASAIGAQSITATALAANSITATAIAANAITATAIAADTITAGQIAAGAITSSELAAGSVGASSLTANAVTATAIAADTITANQIAAGAITASELAAGAVTASAIYAGSVDATKIAAQSITATALAANSITATAIKADAITASAIAAGAVGASEIAAQSITATALAANSITATAIAANAITASAIAAGAITANQLAASAVTASAIAAGTITSTSAIVASLDANKITAGTLDVANRISAGSIKADKLVIGDMENWVVDPYMSGTGAIGGATYLTAANTSVSAGAPYPKIAQLNSRDNLENPSMFRPASGGDTFYCTYWVTADSTAAVNIYPGLWVQNDDGTNAWITGSGISPTQGQTGWQQVAAILTVPASVSGKPVTKARAWIQINGTTGTNTQGWYITGWDHRRQNDATVIANGAITTNQLAANAVTAGNIAAGAVTAASLSASAITATAIAANAITATAISAGAIGAQQLGANSVTATAIKSGSVTADALSAGSITATAIAATAIQASAIAANAVGAQQLAAGSITATAIAATAIQASAIAANAIDATKLAAGSITATAIAATAIQASAIAANAIGAAQLAANSVTATAIKSQSITATAIAAGAITASAIAATAIAASAIQVGAIGAQQLAASAVTATAIAANTITATNGIVQSLDASTITAGILNAQRIAAKSLTVDKLVITSTDNLLSEGTFAAGGIGWTAMGTGISIDATGSRSGSTALKIANNNTQQGIYNNPAFVTTDNSSYRTYVWFKSDVAVPANGVSIYARATSTSGTQTVTQIVSSVAGASGTWVMLSGVYKAPVGTANVTFGLYTEASFTTGNVWFDSAFAARMSNGELIVDGSITANSIAASSINANHINAGAIDGKVITGATVQTASSGARIVLDATSFNGWDASGVNYLNMTAASGVQIQGTVSAQGLASNGTTTIKAVLGPNLVQSPQGTWKSPGLGFLNMTNPVNGTAGIFSDDGKTITITGGGGAGGAGGQAYAVFGNSTFDINMNCSGKTYITGTSGIELNGANGMTKVWGTLNTASLQVSGGNGMTLEGRQVLVPRIAYITSGRSTYPSGSSDWGPGTMTVQTSGTQNNDFLNTSQDGFTTSRAGLYLIQWILQCQTAAPPNGEMLIWDATESKVLASGDLYRNTSWNPMLTGTAYLPANCQIKCTTKNRAASVDSISYVTVTQLA